MDGGDNVSALVKYLTISKQGTSAVGRNRLDLIRQSSPDILDDKVMAKGPAPIDDVDRDP